MTLSLSKYVFHISSETYIVWDITKGRKTWSDQKLEITQDHSTMWYKQEVELLFYFIMALTSAVPFNVTADTQST